MYFGEQKCFPPITDRSKKGQPLWMWRCYMNMGILTQEPWTLMYAGY